jgi:catechol 2,3-dioxygenase-like lactoylglutathione lyase family enzyme
MGQGIQALLVFFAPMPTLVKRTTLIVRSLERSRDFYRDVLGLKVWYDDEIVLSGVGLAAGKAGDRTRLIIMQAADPVVGMIGLLQFTEPGLPAPPRRERLGIGDIVFVLQGDDVAAVHQRALAFGARIHAPPHTFEVRGATGQQLKMTSLSIWDPDDYFIEYNQRHAS